ncbi:uncharacterized protein LOC133291286 [Gastrolobium bilobum]|uniref:uncharacterized protein LOC133291286 n=1 Tax=Gastrolobium bilobum TaxID=150636 RepID=UPI002AAFD7EA|nr:uncharacterized protein LOC133291286 [Gastrolobium bilobum]
MNEHLLMEFLSSSLSYHSPSVTLYSLNYTSSQFSAQPILLLFLQQCPFNSLFSITNNCVVPMKESESGPSSNSTKATENPSWTLFATQNLLLVTITRSMGSGPA